MGKIFLSLFVLILAVGCVKKAENLQENEVSEHFSDIYFTSDTKLYVDKWGNPADGEYVTEVSESSVEIRIEFEEGRINEGLYASMTAPQRWFMSSVMGFLFKMDTTIMEEKPLNLL